jgi:hypothetical protein
MNYLLNIVEAICWSDFICVAPLLAVPTTFCLLLWLKSPLVKSLGRLLATMAVLSLIGWVIVVAGTFCSQMPENGFASFCTLAFGWTYAWIVGLPVILLSFLLRVLHSLPQCFRKKMAGYESSREKQIVHVAILLFVWLVIYPACLCVKPAEMWKKWNGRQYRVKSVDGIVHVQIREDGKVADVSSDASGYHRFHVEPTSAEELIFKSSDVGTRIIQKVDDNWIMQDSKIGDLNRLNTR